MENGAGQSPAALMPRERHAALRDENVCLHALGVPLAVGLGSHFCRSAGRPPLLRRESALPENDNDGASGIVKDCKSNDGNEHASWFRVSSLSHAEGLPPLTKALSRRFPGEKRPSHFSRVRAAGSNVAARPKPRGKRRPPPPHQGCPFGHDGPSAPSEGPDDVRRWFPSSLGNYARTLLVAPDDPRSGRTPRRASHAEDGEER